VLLHCYASHESHLDSHACISIAIPSFATCDLDVFHVFVVYIHCGHLKFFIPCCCYIWFLLLIFLLANNFTIFVFGCTFSNNHRENIPLIGCHFARWTLSCYNHYYSSSFLMFVVHFVSLLLLVTMNYHLCYVSCVVTIMNYCFYHVPYVVTVSSYYELPPSLCSLGHYFQLLQPMFLVLLMLSLLAIANWCFHRAFCVS
jgi:hypothetical protein